VGTVPWRFVVDAAGQEAKVVVKPDDKSARVTYARWIAAYAMRENAGVSLVDITYALGLKSHKSVHRGLAACRKAIASGDKSIKIRGQVFEGSIVDAAQRAWAKAQIRAATERTAA